jgi:hypothetical protein
MLEPFARINMASSGINLALGGINSALPNKFHNSNQPLVKGSGRKHYTNQGNNNMSRTQKISP